MSLLLSTHSQITKIILDRDTQSIGTRFPCSRLLFRTDIEEEKRFFRRAEKKIPYCGKSNSTIISSIHFENTHKKYYPIYIQITKGGIGKQHFEASLTSDRGCGFKVRVECYGYL